MSVNRFGVGSFASSYIRDYKGTDVVVVAISYDTGLDGIWVFDTDDCRHWLCAADKSSQPLECSISLVNARISWNYGHGFRYQPYFPIPNSDKYTFGEKMPIPWI